VPAFLYPDGSNRSDSAKTGSAECSIGAKSNYYWKFLMKLGHWLLSLILMGAIFIGSCTTQNSTAQSPTSAATESAVSNGAIASASPSSSTSPTASGSASTSASPATASPATASPATASNVPAEFANLPQLTSKATVEMEIKGGKVVIEVDGTNAPVTAGNFVDLVERGVYNGLSFHRVVRSPSPFVAQGGDPQSKDPNVPASRLGSGGFLDESGKERNVPLEIKAQGEEQPTYGQVISKPPLLRHKRGAIAMARSQVPDSASSQFYFALADLEFLDGSYAVFGQVTSGMDIVDQIQQGDRITSAKVVKK
jgi:peptidyl-prolyl cis-trans isomerase B (cyclophilin B)